MIVKGTGSLGIGIAQAVDTPLVAAALHDPFFHAGDFSTIAGADLDAVRVEDEVPPVELGLVHDQAAGLVEGGHTGVAVQLRPPGT